MKMISIRLLGASLIAATFAAAVARAQDKPADYPKKPIRIVVGIAPAGTSRDIIRAINAVVARGMNSPETMKALAADGSEAYPLSTPEAFKAKFAKEYADLEKLISAANIKFN